MPNIPYFSSIFFRFLQQMRFLFDACRVFLLVVVVSACGSKEESTQPVADAPAAVASVQKDLYGVNAAARKNVATETSSSEFTKTSDKSAVTSSEAKAWLAKMKSVPLLSVLPDSEMGKLLKQLPSASAFDRLKLIDRYPKLVTLTDQQKEVLLAQMESIVPIALPLNQIVCNCSDDIQVKLCIKERCSNRAGLQSICNRACGTLAAFESQCEISQICAGK